ncbi:hypothetical protein STEPF1_02751 [Streptomyces sp. F-1]|nr:hypothetical protein STEPF1_02751 [Streptomyces sp. F-1]
MPAPHLALSPETLRVPGSRPRVPGGAEVQRKKAMAVNVEYGKILYLAAGAQDLFPWFAVMFGILAVTLVAMLLKTRHH